MVGLWEGGVGSRLREGGKEGGEYSFLTFKKRRRRV